MVELLGFHSLPLQNLVKSFGTSTCPPPYVPFLKSLALDSPICGMFHPSINLRQTLIEMREKDPKTSPKLLEDTNFHRPHFLDSGAGSSLACSLGSSLVFFFSCSSMDSFRVSSWAADSGSPGFEVSVVVNAFPHSTQLFKCCETRQLDKAFPMYKYLRMLQEIIRKSSRFESDCQIPWIFSILEMYLTCVSTHILTKTLKEAFMAHKTFPVALVQPRDIFQNQKYFQTV